MSWETAPECAEIKAALKHCAACPPPISSKLVNNVVILAIKHAKVNPAPRRPHSARP